MYEAFYRLHSDPFRLTPDHRFSFQHRSYARARAYMLYGLQRSEGFVMVTGRPGTGKTTLVEDLLAQAVGGSTVIANLVSTQVGASDLLRMVGFSFGLNVEGRDKASVLFQVRRFLEDAYLRGRRGVLIVDEAQDLSQLALEELRLLTNLERNGHPLLQILLLGQDPLRKLIGAAHLEQLHQRLIAACHLEPLNAEETQAYAVHRLTCSGWQGDPCLTTRLFRPVHAMTQGIPRRINQVMGRLLLNGYVQQCHAFDLDDCQAVIDDLTSEGLLAEREAAVGKAALERARQQPRRVVPKPASAAQGAPAPAPANQPPHEPARKPAAPSDAAMANRRPTSGNAAGSGGAANRTPAASPLPQIGKVYVPVRSDRNWLRAAVGGSLVLVLVASVVATGVLAWRSDPSSDPPVASNAQPPTTEAKASAQPDTRSRVANERSGTRSAETTATAPLQANATPESRATEQRQTPVTDTERQERPREAGPRDTTASPVAADPAAAEDGDAETTVDGLAEPIDIAALDVSPDTLTAISQRLAERFQPASLAVKRVDPKTLRLDVNGLLTFPRDSAQLTGEQRRTLRSLGGMLADVPAVELRILGYTDPLGSQRYNQWLSRRRARTVADVLQANGVPASRIAVRGQGPVEQEDNATARRVEILLTRSTDT